MSTMHEVDYEILGDDLQFVKIELDPGESPNDLIAGRIAVILNEP